MVVRIRSRVAQKGTLVFLAGSIAMVTLALAALVLRQS